MANMKLSEAEKINSLEEAVEKGTSIAIFNETKNFKMPVKAVADKINELSISNVEHSDRLEDLDSKSLKYKIFIAPYSAPPSTGEPLTYFYTCLEPSDIIQGMLVWEYDENGNLKPEQVQAEFKRFDVLRRSNTGSYQPAYPLWLYGGGGWLPLTVDFGNTLNSDYNVWNLAWGEEPTNFKVGEDFYLEVQDYNLLPQQPTIVYNSARTAIFLVSANVYKKQAFAYCLRYMGDGGTGAALPIKNATTDSEGVPQLPKTLSIGGTLTLVPGNPANTVGQLFYTPEGELLAKVSQNDAGNDNIQLLARNTNVGKGKDEEIITTNADGSIKRSGWYAYSPESPYESHVIKPATENNVSCIEFGYNGNLLLNGNGSTMIQGINSEEDSRTTLLLHNGDGSISGRNAGSMRNWRIATSLSGFGSTSSILEMAAESATEGSSRVTLYGNGFNLDGGASNGSGSLSMRDGIFNINGGGTWGSQSFSLGDKGLHFKVQYGSSGSAPSQIRQVGGYLYTGVSRGAYVDGHVVNGQMADGVYNDYAETLDSSSCGIAMCDGSRIEGWGKSYFINGVYQSGAFGTLDTAGFDTNSFEVRVCSSTDGQSYEKCFISGYKTGDNSTELWINEGSRVNKSELFVWREWVKVSGNDSTSRSQVIISQMGTSWDVSAACSSAQNKTKTICITDAGGSITGGPATEIGNVTLSGAIQVEITKWSNTNDCMVRWSNATNGRDILGRFDSSAKTVIWNNP